MTDDDSEDVKTLNSTLHRLIRATQRMSGALWGADVNDMTSIEISILSIVENKPDVILKDIVDVLGIPGSTLTSAIDRLEKRGFLKRVITRRDRRSYGLELTERGKAIQFEHRKGEELLMERIMSTFDKPEERGALLSVLNKLTVILEGKHEPESMV